MLMEDTSLSLETIDLTQSDEEHDFFSDLPIPEEERSSSPSVSVFSISSNSSSSSSSDDDDSDEDDETDTSSESDSYDDQEKTPPNFRRACTVPARALQSNAHDVFLPKVKYGRPRRLLLRKTPGLPLLSVSMRNDVQLINQATK